MRHSAFPTFLSMTMVTFEHLMALDDPGVRQVAQTYGDPDQLLREDWVPDAQGR